MLNTRRERRLQAQRGSVLSALLIIVAFLAITGGALMGELSSQFLVTRTQAGRIAADATVNSSVENAIAQLQTRSVPSRCSTDTGPASVVNLNNLWAAAVPNCEAIVPDQVAKLANGTYQTDGTHVTLSGRDTYLVGDSAGHVDNYEFGKAAPLWTVSLGAVGVTGSPTQSADVAHPGHLMTLVPHGAGVALIDDRGGAASFRCNMPASTTVTAKAAVEVGGSPNFADYAFFDSSGAGGWLYVYDANTGGSCELKGSDDIGRAPAGAPLVFPGIVKSSGSGSTASDEIFVVVTDSISTNLEHWRYTETVDGAGDTSTSLSQVSTMSLSGLVGGNAVGYAASSTTPAPSNPLRLAIAGASGKLAIANIALGPGPSYTMSSISNVTLPGGISRAPYWCHCPGGDLIGAGSLNGSLYVLDAGLNMRFSYNGTSAINTTPAADPNGDWYFGADDGYLYDVEPPAGGALMFKAASIGAGTQVRSSPIVGTSIDGCPGRVCAYFGANGSGVYFVQIGSIRVMDLNSCLTPGSSSTACTGNPRLWARLEVGDPSYVGGRGVNVIGWSYYSP